MDERNYDDHVSIGFNRSKCRPSIETPSCLVNRLHCTIAIVLIPDNGFRDRYTCEISASVIIIFFVIDKRIAIIM